MSEIKFPFSSGKTEIERRHPHIVDRLRLLWGYPEGGQYLASLIVDSRCGRAGFTPEVFSELLALSNVYPPLPMALPNSRGMPGRRAVGFGDAHDVSRRRASA